MKFRAWDGTEFLDSEYWKITNSGIENYYHEGQTLIVQQYSGLEDKNGKEIYEGDIVRYEVEIGEFVTREIVFDYGYFGLDRSTTKNKAQVLWPVACSVEVLGNVFETPELLNNYEKPTN